LVMQDIHYTVDEKQRNVLLTEDGYEAVEDVLQVGGSCRRRCTHTELYALVNLVVIGKVLAGAAIDCLASVMCWAPALPLQ
jgi:preprotein translocase subunit SecA